jgi:acetylornithine/N-succinyldiaminopimelate aminotransferase
VILIVDEVQTGLSRTGSFYASQAVGLEPDILTLAKALAGGLPLSATLIPEKINRLLQPGDHGSTFGGGPVTCALALKVWEVLSYRGFTRDVLERGAYLTELLEEFKDRYSFVKEVKGRGMLQGLVLDGPDIGEIVDGAFGEGLLILSSGENVIRVAPPLIINVNDTLRGMRLLNRIFEKI